MSDSFNTTTANWQGVDDEPTDGSNNLVNSGGIVRYVNKIANKALFIPNTFVYISDGTTGTYNGFYASDFVEINKDPHIQYVLSIRSNGNGSCACAFYSEKNVESYIQDGSLPQGYYTNHNLVIPETAKYMRFGTQENDLASFRLDERIKSKNDSLSDDPNYLVTGHLAGISVIGAASNVIIGEYYGWIPNKYLKLADGEEADTNLFEITSYIKIYKDENFGYYLTNSIPQQGVAACAFYDADKNFISAIQPGEYNDYLLDIPTNAVYLRLCTSHFYWSQSNIILRRKLIINGVLKADDNLVRGKAIVNADCIPYILYDAIKDQTSVVNAGWQFSNNKFICGSVGVSNSLRINKYYWNTHRKFIIDFKKANGILYFSMYSSSAAGKSLVSINFTNNTFNLHNYMQNESVSEILETNSFTQNGDLYRLEYSSPYRGSIVAKLYSLTNGALLSEIKKDYQFGIDAWGLSYDMPRVFCSVAGFEITRFQVVAYYAKDIFLQIVGDSITQGYYSTKKDGCYAGLLAEKISVSRVVWSGRSGAGPNEALNLINSETPILRPKYVLVTIGTNGGITAAQIDNIINAIVSCGSIPIINHIPSIQASSLNLQQTNDLIDERIAAHSGEIYCVRMDNAVSINHDPSQGRNNLCFYDTLHPNDLGHLNMFKQVEIDMPELLP